MLKAAEAGPGTVKELAGRALVGYGAARYTCSRLCGMGLLQAVGSNQAAGRGRASQVLAPADPQAPPPAPGGDLAAVLSGWGAPAKKRPADERDLLAEMLAETRGTPGNRKQWRGG